MANVRPTRRTQQALSLPYFSTHISSQLQKYNAGLHSLGGLLGDRELNISTKFTNDFIDFHIVIDDNMNDLSLHQLSGACISFVFHELFNVGLTGFDLFDQVKDGQYVAVDAESQG